MPDSADQLAKALDARIVLTIELVFIQGKLQQQIVKNRNMLEFFKKTGRIFANIKIIQNKKINIR